MAKASLNVDLCEPLQPQTNTKKNMEKNIPKTTSALTNMISIMSEPKRTFSTPIVSISSKQKGFCIMLNRMEQWPF